MEQLRQDVEALRRRRGRGTTQQQLADERQRLIAQAESLSEEEKATPAYALMVGMVYNVAETYSPEAEQQIARAVKLDPTKIEAWTELGECFWKKRDIEASERCFRTAIEKSQNKAVSPMHNLSMLLRQKRAKAAEERRAIVMESIEVAKAALKLDLNNGHSWFILGNAYMALFFGFSLDPTHLQQAVGAYDRAMADAEEQSSNPDLHHNRGVIHKYMQHYAEALVSFEKAVQLDPSSEASASELSQLKELVTEMHDVRNKHQVKAKKLSHAQAELQKKAPASGSIAEKKEQTGFYVLSRIGSEPLPQVFAVCDSEGTCVCLTVYNMADQVIAIGDVLAIPTKFCQQLRNELTVGDRQLQLDLVRVSDPAVIARNGKPLGAAARAMSQLRIESKGE